jgi:hypothetical protein
VADVGRVEAAAEEKDSHGEILAKGCRIERNTDSLECHIISAWCAQF